MTEEKDPLEDEARARKEWRGEDHTNLAGGGTHLPASEDDGRLTSEHDPADGRPGKGSPGTIPPPD